MTKIADLRRSLQKCPREGRLTPQQAAKAIIMFPEWWMQRWFVKQLIDEKL